MAILGISAFFHDSAAALVDDDGKILAAAQEERFSRKKHDPSFPCQAIRYCLDAAEVSARDIRHVVFYEQPLEKFERIVDGFLTLADSGKETFFKAMPAWVKDKLFLSDLIVSELERLENSSSWRNRLLFTRHHTAHAASAFYPSPFQDALILTIDGVGEYTTTSAAMGRGRDIDILKEISFPHSLGLLYSAFTYYTGFKVNSGEYKMMGLAPYGEPVHVNRILDTIIDLSDDGSFRINPEYFDYFSSTHIINERFNDLFGQPVRKPDQPILQHHMDVSASIQAVLEEAVIRMTRSLAAETGARNLCMAGGVALNCVANGKILRDGRFDRVWVQPAAGDAGGALGAALYAHYALDGKIRPAPNGKDAMRGAYLGPGFSDDEIEACLNSHGVSFERYDETGLINRCAEGLAAGETIGWFQGRMEFGPRALGARSILADPRPAAMQRDLNLKIKKRESFRPFAPAVLAEKAADWFDLGADSPYMLFVGHVSEKHLLPQAGQAEALTGFDKASQPLSRLPAVTHVDGSARVQTVHKETNPMFHALIERFDALTGCPVLVNTSFNVRGEPVVCTPDDAFRCFMGTSLDGLAIGSFYVEKSRQDPLMALKFIQTFAPD